MTAADPGEKVLATFNDMAGAGCSFQAALMAVYELGAADALGAPPPAAKTDKAIPACPYDAIVDAWNAKVAPAGLPRVRSLDDGRRTKIRKFWVWVFTNKRIGQDGTRTARATTSAEAMAWLDAYFDLVIADPFLTGQTPRGREHQGWQPTIEYVLRTETLRNLIEKKPPQ